MKLPESHVTEDAARILILTASDDEEMVFPALEAGADGYLLKETEPAKLRAALSELLHGGVPMTSSIARHVADYFRKRAKTRGEIIRLSPRETELLALLAKGYSNKEIARALDVGPTTIKWHLRNLFSKLNVGGRRHAVQRARMLQLVEPEAMPE